MSGVRRRLHENAEVQAVTRWRCPLCGYEADLLPGVTLGDHYAYRPLPGTGIRTPSGRVICTQAAKPIQETR